MLEKLKALLRPAPKSESWSVVATVCEPLALVRAFTAHHLDAGADRIHLFFDDPFDPAIEYFAGVDRVEVTRCDMAYWEAQLGKRPVDHRTRQATNAQNVYSNCQSDWITHIDADEFLVSDIPVSHMLAQHGKGQQSLRVLPIERTFIGSYDDDALVFDGYFKQGSKTVRIGPKLFGDMGEYFGLGFQGHDVGKTFVRTGAKDRVLRIHYAWENGTKIDTHTIEDARIRLAHFFPQSFEDWQHKYRRRTEIKRNFKVLSENKKKRFSLYQLVSEEQGAQGIKDLFNTLTVLDERQVALMNRHNLLVKKGFDLDRKIAQYLPATISATMPEHVAICVNRTRARPAGAPLFFQIGMQNCGTKSLCSQFARRGFNTAHHDGGKLAQNIADHVASGTALLADYSEIDMFAGLFNWQQDGSLLLAQQHFAALDAAFPQAVFLLNRISIDGWLAGLSHHQDGKLLTQARQIAGLSSDDQVRQMWVSQWKAHQSSVRGHFADRPEKLIEFSIDKVKPGFVFDELKQRGLLWDPK